MKSLRSFLAASAAAVLALSSSTAQAAPPANDNFANRMTLTGQAVSSPAVTIDEATREGLERSDTEYQTVWYTWTASQDGIVTLTTAGTTNRSRISVFNGASLANLIQIDSTDDSSLSFYVKGGLAYQVCLGTFDQGRKGIAVLNINNKATTITTPTVVALPAGTNDNFANAAPLASAPISAFTYALESTRENQEPDYTGNQTVWWTWTAPADALVTMNTVGSSYESSYYRSRLSVLNGSALTNLTVVAYSTGSSASVTFPAKAGTSYVVCVGMENTINSGLANAATSVLNITTAPLNITSPVIIETPANANDNFANAQTLGTNAVVSGFGFNASASTENLETGTGNLTLWWSWTAPQDGNLTVSGTGTDFTYEASVFTGTGLTSLTSVAFFGNFGRASDHATIPVTAGTVYHFAIGSLNSSYGTEVLNLTLAPGLSHVSIAADQGATTQSQTSVLTFTISRDGDLSKLVKVNYAESITVDGVPHQYTGTQKLKAGKASAKLKVTTGGSYGKAVVKFTLKSGDGYVVGTPKKARSTVLGH